MVTCSLCCIALARVSDADTDRIIVGAFPGALQRPHAAHHQMMDSVCKLAVSGIFFKVHTTCHVGSCSVDLHGILSEHVTDERTNPGDGLSNLRDAALAAQRTGVELSSGNIL